MIDKHELNATSSTYRVQLCNWATVLLVNELSIFARIHTARAKLIYPI